jgi:CDP-6-deoxy-D-xylo-4-hexulose-3-dehydrase
VTIASAAAHNAQRAADVVRDEIMELITEYCRLAHGATPFVPGKSRVPVSGRVFDETDVRSLVDSALEFWLTTGRFNKQFETGLADRIGVKHALTVNSGSSANLVAFSALTSPSLQAGRLILGN